jgi:hypothetical protein
VVHHLFALAKMRMLLLLSPPADADAEEDSLFPSSFFYSFIFHID